MLRQLLESGEVSALGFVLHIGNSYHAVFVGTGLGIVLGIEMVLACFARQNLAVLCDL